MKCKKCGYENKEEANFCVYCGNKLKDTCNCWVKKKDNYDCGESSCLGYDLLVKEVKMKKMEQEKRIKKLKEDIEKRITSECEIIKKADDPGEELAQYVRNIGWENPEMAALIVKIAVNNKFI